MDKRASGMTMRTKAKPTIGAERFLVEHIATPNVEALARKNGWTGGDAEYLRDFCEPENAATYSVHATLAEAIEAAKAALAKGDSFYGAALIDRQVYEEPHDDQGNLIRVPPQWERHELFEVAGDGECIKVAS